MGFHWPWVLQYGAETESVAEAAGFGEEIQMKLQDEVRLPPSSQHPWVAA